MFLLVLCQRVPLVDNFNSVISGHTFIVYMECKDLAKQ